MSRSPSLPLTNAGVGAHHQHGEVGAVAGEAEDGGLQVLVVSGQINEGDHLGRALADLLRCARLAVVHHLHGDQKADVGSFLSAVTLKQEKRS